MYKLLLCFWIGDPSDKDGDVMRDVLHQEDERSVQIELDVFPERSREKNQLNTGGGGALGSFLVHGDHRLLDDLTDG